MIINSHIDGTPLMTVKRLVYLILLTPFFRLRFKVAKIFHRSVFTEEYINDKALFIHIPKCAGMAISHALYDKPTLGHFSVKRCRWESKEKFENYFKYTIVRNPYDRLYSAYCFLNKGGMSNKDLKFSHDNKLSTMNFEEFVMNWLDESNIYKGIHLVPQVDFITINGEIAVDYVGRQENLGESFVFIRNKLCRKKAKLSIVNQSEREANYLLIYTDEMKEKVQKIYAKDFEMLNYEY